MSTDTTPRRGGKRPGAGRKPTDPATHKERRTITLSPEAWAFVDQLSQVDKRRGVSGAVEHLVRAHHWFATWQAKQQAE